MRVGITGASFGIGKSLAYLYAKEGYNLSLVSRNIDALTKIKEDIENKYNVDVKVYSFDLTNDVYPLFLKLKDNDIDIWINNAAMGYANRFLDHDINKEHDLLNLNIKALTDFCYYFGYLFKEKKKGMILNISSVGSMMPGPFIQTYYASKAYLNSLTLSLSYEFKRDNIKIKAFNLPRVDTNFDMNAGRTKALKKGISPSKIALKIYKKSKSKKAIINIGFLTKVTSFLSKVLPSSLFLHFVGKSLE